MTEKNTGTIYKLPSGNFGLALDKHQKDEFVADKKVFLKLYMDIHCQKPLKDEDGKQYCALKNAANLRIIGFQD